jgi:hypothetical protein
MANSGYIGLGCAGVRRRIDERRLRRIAFVLEWKARNYGPFKDRSSGMRNFFLAIALLVVFAGGCGALAQDDFPTHFACDFNQGYSWTYADGKFKSAPPADLAFEIGRIDLDGQTASLILDGKQANGLKIVRAIDANHFIEVVNEGFLNLTTIYDRDPATGKYPAVHSRHFGLFGQPVFAQYAGSCVAKP